MDDLCVHFQPLYKPKVFDIQNKKWYFKMNGSSRNNRIGKGKIVAKRIFTHECYK